MWFSKKIELQPFFINLFETLIVLSTFANFKRVRVYLVLLMIQSYLRAGLMMVLEGGVRNPRLVLVNLGLEFSKGVSCEFLSFLKLEKILGKNFNEPLFIISH